MLAMRTVLLSALILEKLNLHVEAAGQLLKLTSLVSSWFSLFNKLCLIVLSLRSHCLVQIFLQLLVLCKVKDCV